METFVSKNVRDNVHVLVLSDYINDIVQALMVNNIAVDIIESTTGTD